MDECLKRRNGFANNNSKMVFDRTKEDSSMDDDSLNSDSEAARSPSSLHTLMSSIMDERKRDYVTTSEKDDFLLVHDHNAFWAHMFSKYFLDSPEDTHKDDMLFYVRKTPPESSDDESSPNMSVEVYRKWSTCQPLLTDAEIDFEETVYLNFILQHFEYYVTCAVCTKSGDGKPVKVLRRLTQRVYASPSRRKMDSKGTEEEITYPNIFFTIDNFEEAFANQIVQESEMICVELVAVDCLSSFKGALFRGSVSHEALKGVFEAKGNLGRRMPLSWWFREPDRIEFIKMSGPNGKGCAEMAVSCAKPSVPEAQSTQVLTTDNSAENSEEFHSQSRRSSDPNFGWHRIFHGSLKRIGLKKSRSNMENLGAGGMSASYSEQANSSSIDESEETVDECQKDDLGKSFTNGGGWHWWKERRSSPKSLALYSFLTYVSLPWHRIIADICGENGRTEALFFSEDDDDHVEKDAL